MVDQVLIAIAAAVAGKAVEPLTENATAALRNLRKAVIQRFRAEPEAREALDAAQVDYEDVEAVEVLAEHLDSAAGADSEIRRLTEELRPHFSTGAGSVTNTVYGNVGGDVIQTRDVHGGINLNRGRDDR